MVSVACVLVYSLATHRFLVQRRSRQLDQGNTYHIPSGYVEATETSFPAKAAQRELQEETGYEGRIDMEHLYTTWVTDRQFPVYVYVATVTDEFRTRCNWESTEQIWVSYETLCRTLSPLHTGLNELIKSDAFQAWVEKNGVC
jgi:8-oxo-dGTP pyrophosphatase MutT (NUDIX family)